MMCHRIGRPPISTIGLGLMAVSSERRVPNPPASMTTFIASSIPAVPAAAGSDSGSSRDPYKISAYDGGDCTDLMGTRHAPRSLEARAHSRHHGVLKVWVQLFQ